ncbi:MAG: 1-acyl-sn-glycerol-3-phosphate acyltransferase [Candidatus Aminicenantes bacterium]|nr:1-acyl-sn-glycerol-3-phosphate acyltransferase [Candidatus Aminicenantes bacterium]
MILRTAVVLLLYAAVIVCAIPVVFLAVLFRFREPLLGVGKWTMKASRTILGLRLEVEGDGGEEEAGPCVFMSNHLSLLDGPALFLAIRRPVRVIMKKSIFRIPVAGLGMRHTGFVPVDRKGTNGGRTAIAEAARMIRTRGYSFLIFPEGTRSRTGTLGPFRRGGFFLAREAGVPIVPISIRGSFELMPKGCLIPRRGRIRVVFHPTVPAPDEKTADLTAWMNAVRERIALVPE